MVLVRRFLASLADSWDQITDRFKGLPTPAKVLVALVAVAFVYALPLLRPPLITTDQIDFGGVMFTVAIFALIALGLNIVIGYAGLLDLGYVGFYATGAYTIGVITSQHGSWPFFLTLPVAVAVTMFLSCRPPPLTLSAAPTRVGACH